MPAPKGDKGATHSLVLRAAGLHERRASNWAPGAPAALHRAASTRPWALARSNPLPTALTQSPRLWRVSSPQRVPTLLSGTVWPCCSGRGTMKVRGGAGVDGGADPSAHQRGPVAGSACADHRSIRSPPMQGKTCKRAKTAWVSGCEGGWGRACERREGSASLLSPAARPLPAGGARQLGALRWQRAPALLIGSNPWQPLQRWQGSGGTNGHNSWRSKCRAGNCSRADFPPALAARSDHLPITFPCRCGTRSTAAS